jgi:hypothetical protein
VRDLTTAQVLFVVLIAIVVFFAFIAVLYAWLSAPS